MRHVSGMVGLAALGLSVLASCQGGSPHEAEEAAPAPTPTPAALSQHDVQLYLTVRAKALQKIEESLEGIRVADTSLVTRLGDTAGAERSAASALGVPWAVYAWVRDEIARLLSEQRQQEDARVLALELTRTRKDLAWQEQNVKDDASRQFLHAQIASLDAKLAAIERERRVPPETARQLELIAEVRADLATLQGRQDRVQRRLRELLDAARASAATGMPTTIAPAATPGAQPARGSSKATPRPAKR